MRPLSSSLRVALVAMAAFTMASALGAGGATLVDGEGEAAPVSAVASPAGTTTEPRHTGPARTVPVPPAAAHRAPRPLLVPGAHAAFAALQATLGGEVALAVAPVGQGPLESFGARALRSAPGAHAWSTMKVALVTQLLRSVRGAQGLTPGQRGRARNALTQSDNHAAAAIFTDLEARHGGLAGASSTVTQLLRRSGDLTTEVSTARPNPNAVSTYGQTEWPAAGAARFLRALARGCLLPPGDTRFVLDLMRDVRAERAWGIGGAGYDGSSPVAFKGGWGPEADGSWVVRQMGVIGSARRAIVVAIVARAPARAAGEADVTAVARWVRKNISLVARKAVSCR